MPRDVRTHLPSDAATPSRLTPKHLTKEQFGRRLQALMLDRGWNQSELGRRAGLPRDSISVYVRGQSLPTPKSLKALSDALSVSPEELLPNHTESAIDADHPALDIRVSPGSPDTAWLRVNRLVTLRTALEVAKLLEADQPLKKDAP